MRERRERPRGTLEWAKYYRDAGLSVIPLRPHDKRPACPWKTYQQRLASDEDLEGWFSDDEANIGIVCGAISGGLVVADFDNALNLRSFLDVLPELEEATVRVSTARGGHIYLITTENIRTFQVEEFGLDIKGEGSYVLAPPSIHPSDKPYEFANEATEIMGVADFLAWLKHSLAALGFDWTPPGSSDNGQRAGLDVAAALSGLKQGNRNETFARLVGRLHRNGWDMAEIMALLAPHAERVDFPLADLKEEVRGICGRYARPEPRGRPVLAGELIKAGPAKIPWRVHGYVREGGFTALAGRPKAGKSTSAAYMAKAVARGEPIWGMTTKQCKVLILALEEHEDDVALRLGEMGVTEKDPVYVYAGPLRLERDADELRAWIEEDGYRLVIVDTLARFWTVEDTSSNAQIDASLAPLLAFARESGVAFLFLCQLRKTAAQDVADILGGTELAAMMDVVVALRRDPDDRQQRILQDFSRYSQTPESLVVRLEDGRYEAVGEKAELGRKRQKQDVMDALETDYLKVADIAKAAGLAYNTAKPLLEELVHDGLAEAEGKGGRHDPRCFRLPEELA